MALDRNNTFLNWLWPNRAGAHSKVYEHYIGGRGTRTGEAITPEKALENPTVFACVSLLAQTIAQLPWHVSLENDVGNGPIAHPLQDLLDKPNPSLTDFELKHSIVVDLLTYGNCYILKLKHKQTGRVTELIPLPAFEMTPTLTMSGKHSYKRQGGEVYSADDVIHIRDFIGGTINGLSKVNQCASLIAIDNAIDNTLADNFRNGTAISGVVSFQTPVPPEMKKLFIDGWTEKFGGGSGSSRGSIALLDDGATFTQINPISPADADMLELKKQTMTRIAAVFRVPAYAIEIADGSKYDNLSQRQSGFYRDSIAPIVRNISSKLTDGLLSKEKNLSIRFDTDELIKGDMQTVVDVAVKAVEGGLLLVNEARDLIGYPPSDVLPQIPDKKPITFEAKKE